MPFFQLTSDTIEAHQYTDKGPDIPGVSRDAATYPYVKTPYGIRRVTSGDWVVLNAEQEYLIYSDDAFRAQFKQVPEPVEEPAKAQAATVAVSS